MRETKSRVGTVTLTVLLIGMLTLSFNIQQVKADWWSAPAQLTDNTVNDYYPYLSDDDGKIAFQSVVDGDSEIFVINSDGSGLKQLTSNTASDHYHSISGDGGKIAFASDGDGDDEIFVINSDGSGLKQLTSNTANDRSTSISGDGGKIAFTSDVDGDYEIFVVNSDGSGLTQLTSNTANEYYPHISGDGSKVAFYSDRDGDLEIFVVNSDGSGLKQLTFNTAGDWMPSISGDGGKIAFNSDIDGDSEIFVINSDGSGLKQLTFNTANDYVSYDSISGDGGKIAFTSDVDGDYEIFVVNSDGSGLTQLTSNTADDYHHSISGDGGKIAFNSDIDRDYEIWVISAQVQLTIEVVGLGITNPAPDSYLYDSGTMVLVDSQPEVGWMLDHWLLDGSDVSHDASYTITMDADHTLTAVFVKVPQPEPPVASFTYSPSAPEVGETVTFDAGNSYDPDGEITNYAWDFGDGTNGTGVTATHSYASASPYSVKLTVTDNDGLIDTDTKGFDVDVPPPNGDGRSVAPFPLWVLAPVIGGITGVTAVLVYLKKRKPKEEVLKPPEEIPPQKVKEFPKLNAKCCDTIALLNSFIEDPSPTNDRKAWKSFKEFITITEQIEDEYAELIEIRNKLAVLRRKRNEYRSAGLDDLADKTEGLIQRNYGDSIRIIKEIQEKLPQLGN